MDCFRNKKNVITITTDDIVSRFEVFANHKLDTLHQTEIMRTEWLQLLYKKDIYPTIVPLISVHIGCFNIFMNYQ